jgi:sortase A
VKKGDRIVFELPYGTFVYRVDKTQIVDDSALWVTDPVGHPQLVLTACHPLYSAAQRIVAFARLVDRRPATVRKA